MSTDVRKTLRVIVKECMNVVRDQAFFVDQLRDRILLLRYVDTKELVWYLQHIHNNLVTLLIRLDNILNIV